MSPRFVTETHLYKNRWLLVVPVFSIKEEYLY